MTEPPVRIVDTGLPVEIIARPPWMHDPEFVALGEQNLSGDADLDHARAWLESVGEQVEAAAGHDITPGHDQLHHYWTRGEGLAKWFGHPHPWTRLRNHLEKHVGRERANRMASQWYHEVTGHWIGEEKGDNPVGPG